MAARRYILSLGGSKQPRTQLLKKALLGLQEAKRRAEEAEHLPVPYSLLVLQRSLRSFVSLEGCWVSHRTTEAPGVRHTGAPLYVVSSLAVGEVVPLILEEHGAERRVPALPPLLPLPPPTIRREASAGLATLADFATCYAYLTAVPVTM